VIGRLDEHLADLDSDVLSATRSDLVSYRSHRTQRQIKPVGASVWGGNRSSWTTSTASSSTTRY
jgi:hypothetical protein